MNDQSQKQHRGKPKKTHKSLRFCPFCPTHVEDEKHFLLECQPYQHLRKELFIEIKQTSPNITNQPHAYRFLTLTKETYTKPVSRFITRAKKLRDFLMEKHKMHG